MDSLFSHANTDPSAEGSARPPATLAAQVIVPRNPEDSFAGFTDGIHLWWPVDQTRFGEGTHPEFTQGELFEEDMAGNSALWATVTAEPLDGRFELAWHHEGNPNRSSHLAVSITADGVGTRVSVVHDGWAEGKLGYEQFKAAPDWPAILASYRRFMGGAE